MSDKSLIVQALSSPENIIIKSDAYLFKVKRKSYDTNWSSLVFTFTDNENLSSFSVYGIDGKTYYYFPSTCIKEVTEEGISLTSDIISCKNLLFPFELDFSDISIVTKYSFSHNTQFDTIANLKSLFPITSVVKEEKGTLELKTDKALFSFSIAEDGSILTVMVKGYDEEKHIITEESIRQINKRGLIISSYDILRGDNIIIPFGN